MEHGVTWLNFLPFYEGLEHFLRSTFGQGKLFGQPLVAQHVIAAVIVAGLVLAIGIKTRLDLARAGEQAIVPEPNVSLRNLIEVPLEAIYGLMSQIIGKECGRYFPVIGTLALFIFISNLLGLVPGFTPPTDNWNTTFACGFFVFFYYNFHGLRANGIQHIAHMANPVGTWWGWFMAPLMFPIEFISHCIRPLTLGVRLAANMVADHAVLGAFHGLFPIALAIPFFVLGLFVCILQTFVFVLLTMIYIGMAVEDFHEHGAQPRGAVAHA